MLCFGPSSKNVIESLQQEIRGLQQEIASAKAQLDSVKAENFKLKEHLNQIIADSGPHGPILPSQPFATEEPECVGEMQELGDLFDSLDREGTGSLRLSVLWQSLVADRRHLDKVAQILGMVNNGGIVSKDAFMKHMTDMPGAFTEEQDDSIVIYRLFHEVDTDGNGTISLEELESALIKFVDERHTDLAKALSEEVQMIKQSEGRNDRTFNGSCAGLSFQEFSRLVGMLPRVRGERLLWVRSLGLDGELARLLDPGTVFDGLSGLLQMNEDQLRYVCDKFSRRLPILLRDGVRKLSSRGRVESPGVISEAQKANSKFCGTAGAFHGRFATLNEFYQGPEGLIGQPNPKLLEGMYREHCKRDSSMQFFVSSNYWLRTTAEWEWYWVQNPSSESLPIELQKRLEHTNMYPGEVSDVLKECEIQLSISWANFKVAALKSCKEYLHARLKRLSEISAESVFELSVVDDGTDSEKDNEAEIQIRLNSSHRISNAIRTEMLGVVAKLGFKSDTKLPNAPGSDSDWEFHLKISKTEMNKALQEQLALELGNLFDEKQRLRGARIIPRQRPDDEKGRIILVIAIPCSDLKSKSEIHRKLAAFELGEIGLAINAVEHQYCQSVNEATTHLKQGRTRRGTFDEFFASDAISEKQAKLAKKGLKKLIKEEVIALRLYTGPPFILYNAVLRGFPFSITDLLREKNGEMNRFETTIFVICSGISKLSRLTDVPPNRLLYRGLGGMLLPDEFWKESDERFKGGVEYGLMSTTTKRSVAVEYSGIKHKRGILLEIQAGRIDIGASISFLSQYPGEEEYLMQPLSCMEVIGQPRLEKTTSGEILVFPLRVNINLKSLTVEDLTQRRKVPLVQFNDSSQADGSLHDEGFVSSYVLYSKEI